MFQYTALHQSLIAILIIGHEDKGDKVCWGENPFSLLHSAVVPNTSNELRRSWVFAGCFVLKMFPITYQNKIVSNCLDLFRLKSTWPTEEELWEINNMDVIREYSENNEIIIRLMLSNRLWCEFIGFHWNTLSVNQKESQFTPFISRVTAQSIIQRSKALLFWSNVFFTRPEVTAQQWNVHKQFCSGKIFNNVELWGEHLHRMIKLVFHSNYL